MKENQNLHPDPNSEFSDFAIKIFTLAASPGELTPIFFWLILKRNIYYLQ